MTAAEARELADETIRWWQEHRVTAREAMQTLSGRRLRYSSWQDCTSFIMRWEMRHAARQAIPPFKHGPLPQVPDAAFRLAA